MLIERCRFVGLDMSTNQLRAGKLMLLFSKLPLSATENYSYN